MTTRLETHRLIIRSFGEADCETYLAMVCDPEVRRFLPQMPLPTRETFVAALERRRRSEEVNGYSMWAVELKKTGTVIGQCGLQPVDRVGPGVELAYHYVPASWNQGSSITPLPAPPSTPSSPSAFPKTSAPGE